MIRRRAIRTSTPAITSEEVMLELEGTMAEAALVNRPSEAPTDMADMDVSLREGDPSAGASVVRTEMAAMEAAEDMEAVVASEAAVAMEAVVASEAVVAMEAEVASEAAVALEVMEAMEAVAALMASSVVSIEATLLAQQEGIEAMAAAEVLEVTEVDSVAGVASASEVASVPPVEAAMITPVKASDLVDTVELEEVAATEDLHTTRDGEKKAVFPLPCVLIANRSYESI